MLIDGDKSGHTHPQGECNRLSHPSSVVSGKNMSDIRTYTLSTNVSSQQGWVDTLSPEAVSVQG